MGLAAAVDLGLADGRGRRKRHRPPNMGNADLLTTAVRRLYKAGRGRDQLSWLSGLFGSLLPPASTPVWPAKITECSSPVLLRLMRFLLA